MLQVHTQVLMTKNYDMFSQIDGNRKINPLNLNQIRESMKQKQLVIPIVVNEKHEIIDGQHRFHACKYLGLPVYYIMQQGYGLSDVIRANVNGGRKWSDADYLNMFVNEEKKNYVNIQEVISDFNINVNDYIKILAKYQEKNVPVVKREFREGNVSELGHDRVIQFLMQLESFRMLNVYKSAGFISAFLELSTRDDYSHESMEKKLNTNSHNLEKCFNKDEYIALLCNKVYSYGGNAKPIYYDANTKRFYQ